MQNLFHYKLNNAKLLGMKIKFEIAAQLHSDSYHITLKATSHTEMNYCSLPILPPKSCSVQCLLLYSVSKPWQGVSANREKGHQRKEEY
jgi:hypothetical protein